MVPLCLIGMFIAANVAVFFSYWHPALGLSWLAVQMVYGGAPILRGSLALTLLGLPLTVFTAYYTCEGDHREFRNHLLFWSCVFPGLVWMIVLAGHHLEPMEAMTARRFQMPAVASIANWVFARLIARTAWRQDVAGT